MQGRIEEASGLRPRAVLEFQIVSSVSLTMLILDHLQSF